MISLPSALRARPASLTLRLALSACFVAPFAPAAAQTVVVTGTREPLPLDRVTADVVVIDAARIRESTADSVEDLLRREAGVQVSRTGGPGKTASVFIRGMSGNGTVVLVDGVRIGSATLGLTAFEALQLADIDHIEVLRGPGSSLYGADAVGGVVQIFTRKGSGAPRFNAHVAAGEYGAAQASVGVSGSSGAFDYAASLSHERDDGVSTLRPNDQFGYYNPDRDGHRRTSAQLKLGFTPAEGHRLGFSVLDTRLNSRFDTGEAVPPTYNDATSDPRDRIDTRVVALDYRGRIARDWTLSALVSHDNDDSRSGDLLVYHYRTRRDQATVQAAWTPSADTQLVIAAERLEEKADTDAYDDSRRNSALVLGYTGRFGANTLQADVRYDDNSAYGSHTTGRLGWSFALTPAWSVRALVGTTFRAPSFNDLYFPGYGVPSLEAERGRSVELGTQWRQGTTEASATVYRNRVKNLIQYQADVSQCPATGAFTYGCADNIGRARLEGATFTAGHRWGDLRVRATVDFLDAKDADTGARLTRRAAHQESVSADYDWGAFTFGAGLLSVGSRPDGTAKLGGYTLVDLSARWRFAQQWQLEAKLLNATDRDYQPAFEYNALGRQAWLGLRYTSKGL